jgi:hypothetical protein
MLSATSATRLEQHALAHAEQPGVPRGAPDQHLDDVAGAVVGGEDAVGDAHRHGPRVVGDDPVVHALEVAVGHAGGLDQRPDARLEEFGGRRRHARP